MPKLLDGRVVASGIAIKLKKQMAGASKVPTLAIIQVGDLAASSVYIKRKIKFAEEIGAKVKHLKFSKNISSAQLLGEVMKLNVDSNVHGIIVQLPLPTKLDAQAIIETIDPRKDVDGLRTGSDYMPATARGVMALLDYYEIPLVGAKAVVVGRSALVGKPIALALLAANATVTVCHRQTKDLASETSRADLLIVAAGAPKLIKQKHVQKGQVIIDVGLTATDKGLMGDVDRNSVDTIAKSISPVPGGVGPMTVASLFLNLWEAYQILKK
jgi:methylenetetrahydrofolate dehydrogenase (NADP+)/methenyltetrahydrofolate cyclohydrolase